MEKKHCLKMPGLVQEQRLSARGKAFCSQPERVGRVPDSQPHNELTLPFKRSFAFSQ